ncbi:MAG: glycoside hydrolase family 97 catalytic domain-containing protein [Niabella sp.]
MIKKTFIAIVVLMLTQLGVAQPLISPNGKLSIAYSIAKDEKNIFKYNIHYTNKTVINDASLGLTGWYENVAIETVMDTSVNTSWHPVYGERSVVKDEYNQRIIVLKRTDNSADRLWIIVRAYNEGIALRYFFPEDPLRGGRYITINEERTNFKFSPGAECWFAPYAQASYSKLALKNWPDQSERPLTIELQNGLYVSLCEAALLDYARTKFYIRKDEENIIRCSMYGRVEQMAPYATPWRVVMVSEKPTTLLQNNDLILNLNAPNKIKNTSWIKPGKIMRINDLTTTGAKKVIDFAAKHHIEYVHFDTKWYGSEVFAESDPTKTYGPELNMKEVVAYGKSKGVGVWVYVNQRALYKYLDEILPLYKEWGIAGIKFGFVWVGSQFWTTWLHNAVAKCAQHNLMVDIHDEYRPTGVSRTYPNLLTQEGIRGNEEFPDGNLNTVLPFTRFIAGAADYTIVYYSRRELKPHLKNVPEHKILKNTSAHQMALSVIYYSPLQYLYWYDNPTDIEDEPEIDFFDRLHTVWDDTKVINGEIGKYITIARKKENSWYIGGITNNDTRTMSITLDFLDAGKKYKASIYTDGGDKVKTRTHVAIKQMKVTAKTSLKIPVPARGGYAMIIEAL